MYTNGVLANKINNLSDLIYLCISRAHNLDSVNKDIMGINYDVNKLIDRSPIKFFLMLCQQGIRDKDGFLDYVNWASNMGVKKIVVREIVNLSEYNKSKDYVSMTSLVKSLDLSRYIPGKNPIMGYRGVFVEFDHFSSDESKLVLRANGIYKNFEGVKSDTNRD